MKAKIHRAMLALLVAAMSNAAMSNAPMSNTAAANPLGTPIPPVAVTVPQGGIGNLPVGHAAGNLAAIGAQATIADRPSVRFENRIGTRRPQPVRGAMIVDPRMRYYNGNWWYQNPNHSWSYFQDGRWHAMDGQNDPAPAAVAAKPAARAASAYRGPRFSRPSSVAHMLSEAGPTAPQAASQAATR